MNRLFRASVTENRQLIENHYLLTLHPLKKISRPKPGTFFMVSVDRGLDPLLKRPFSIHRWLGEDFQLLYRVTGKGTRILGSRKAGDVIDLIGPLGNGFSVKKNLNAIVLIAGGIGIAPLFALAEDILSRRKKAPLLFYGARTKEELLRMDGLRSIGIDPAISTDDGTMGQKDNAVGIFRKHIDRNPSALRDCTVFACGPEPMFKSLSTLLKKYGLTGFAALEQNMACGIGTCLGCVVRTVKGYRRVCKEGPVFSMEDIVW